jgi:hypothetical protein
MSVLGREQDSYQRALEAYQRQINRYNRSVDKYQASLVRDQNGNILVQSGGGFGNFSMPIEAVPPGGGTPIAASLPKDFDESLYGYTDIPGGQGYRYLRQNPIEAKRETVEGLSYFSDEYGGTSYYMFPDGRVFDTYGWRHGGASGGNEYTPPTHSFFRDLSTYMAAPAEWDKKFNRKAPSATPAQASKIGAPSLAEVESGLIGEVMKGKGVRYGVPVYRPKGDA